MKNPFTYLLELFFPRRCAICHDVLQDFEDGICLHCHAKLPRIAPDTIFSQKLEKLFWGKFPLGKVASYCYYQKGNDTTTLIHQLKYKGRPDLGVTLGRLMATELQARHFFEGIDILIPVPLHPHKEKIRGYNQSLCIAQGIAAITHLPIDHTSLQRTHYTETQTHKSADARWNNVSGRFALPHPELLAHRHILLIDDVLTTSATLTACADTFHEVPDIRISILTLGWATY